jgi:integrase
MFRLSLGRSPTGQRIVVVKSGYATRRDAQDALDEAKARYAGGVEPSRQRLGEYLEQWLAGKRSIRPTTRRSYQGAIRLYIGPAIGSVKLRDLRPHHVDRMLELAARGTRGKPVSVKTVRVVHGVLRAALRTAVRRRLIAYNPAEHVDLPAAGPVRTNVWTVEQATVFLTATADDRLAALWRLLLVTGMRRGEAVGLQWADVDLDGGWLMIRRQVVDTGLGLVVGEPKPRRGERPVALDLGTVSLLAEHRDRQAAERAIWAECYEDGGYVFTREDGRVLRPEWVTRRFQALARQHELPVLRLHDLRHTNASIAFGLGLPMKTISDRLGHSTTTFTQDAYTHLLPVTGREAADAIGAAFDSPPPGGRTARHGDVPSADGDEPEGD